MREPRIVAVMPVETTVGGATTDRYIPMESIAWAEAVNGQTDHCYVTYNEGGFRNVEVMVPFSLNDILYVGSTGTSSLQFSSFMTLVRGAVGPSFFCKIMG